MKVPKPERGSSQLGRLSGAGMSHSKAGFYKHKRNTNAAHPSCDSDFDRAGGNSGSSGSSGTASLSRMRTPHVLQTSRCSPWGCQKGDPTFDLLGLGAPSQKSHVTVCCLPSCNAALEGEGQPHKDHRHLSPVFLVANVVRSMMAIVLEVPSQKEIRESMGVCGELSSKKQQIPLE